MELVIQKDKRMELVIQKDKRIELVIQKDKKISYIIIIICIEIYKKKIFNDFIY
jgi:hypothetical protein